jgi:hypothetical protein
MVRAHTLSNDERRRFNFGVCVPLDPLMKDVVV